MTETEIGIVVMIGQIEETEGRAGLEGAADVGEAEEVIGLVEVGIRCMQGHEHCVIQIQAVDTHLHTKKQPVLSSHPIQHGKARLTKSPGNDLFGGFNCATSTRLQWLWT